MSRRSMMRGGRNLAAEIEAKQEAEKAAKAKPAATPKATVATPKPKKTAVAEAKAADVTPPSSKPTKRTWGRKTTAAKKSATGTKSAKATTKKTT